MHNLRCAGNGIIVEMFITFRKHSNIQLEIVADKVFEFLFKKSTGSKEPIVEETAISQTDAPLILSAVIRTLNRLTF